MPFGEQIRQRREELGLMQVDVADLATVSERFVRDLEHDKATLRLDKVNAVLDVLGLQLALVSRQGQ